MALPQTSSEKVVLVSLSHSVSGTERVVSDIVRNLSNAGGDVSLILPGDEALDKFAERERLFTRDVARIRPVTGRQSVGTNLLLTYRLLRKWRPAIVHFHCPNHRWGLDVVLAARLARVPNIVRTEHNPLMAPPGRAAGILLKLTDPGIVAFTYVSAGNQERFERFLPYRRGRGHVISNGIDPSTFSPQTLSVDRLQLRQEFGIPTNAKIAVFVGSIGGRRSLKSVFEALQKLRQDPTLADEARQWHIMAIGPSIPEEQALPESYGLAPVVHFTGRRDDIARILPGCDLFVTTSAYEGMSIAILEAWAVGLPVLSTQVDGISDVIGEDAFRRWMAPHNNPAAFASIWGMHMKGDGKLLELHKGAMVRVRESLTTSNMVSAYLDLYKGLGTG